MKRRLTSLALACAFLLPALCLAAEESDTVARGKARLPEPPVVVTADVPLVDPTAASFEFVPQLSVVSPWKMELNNGQVIIPYSETIAGVPALHAGLALRYWTPRPVSFSLIAKAGYGTREGSVPVIARTGYRTTELVRLHWVPLSIANRTELHIPGVRFMKPSVTLGGGVQWMLQRSESPGIDHSFWLPFLYVTPALTFLEGDPGRDWFGGFTFGTSMQSTIGTVQTVRGWSFDMSFTIFL